MLFLRDKRAKWINVKLLKIISVKYDIFISYSHADAQYAKLLSEEFSLSGLRVFFDKEGILASQEFASIISSRVENCSVLLYLRSEAAEQSRWVKNELKYAIGLEKQIVIVDLENNSANDSFDSSACKVFSLNSLSNDEIRRVVEEILLAVSPTQIEYEKVPTDHMDDGIPNKQELLPGTNGTKYTCSWKKHLLKILLLLFCAVVLIFLFMYRKCTYLPNDRCNESPLMSPCIVDKMNSDSLIGDSIACDGIWHDSVAWHDIQVSSIDTSSIDYIEPIEDNIYTEYNLNSNRCLYWGFFVVSLLFLGVIIYKRKNKKYSVKIHNRDSKQKISLLVDGVFECDIQPLGLVQVKRKKGEYLFTAMIGNDEMFNACYKLGRLHNNEIFPIESIVRKQSNLITYRCFIGGSTSIINERNAARSVLSILYNQYEKYNFYITAHTFEDFKNKHKIEGHQFAYDEFIRLKADCAIFIICKYIGPKTLNEYKIAIDTFESTNEERPSIFVYNDVSGYGENEMGTQDKSIAEFRNLVNSKKAYWRDYKDIETLMLKMKDDISAELTDVLEMRPKLVRKQ